MEAKASKIPSYIDLNKILNLEESSGTNVAISSLDEEIEKCYTEAKQANKQVSNIWAI